MEIKEFIEDLTEVLEIDNPSALTAETVFKELEVWSSLTLLSIIAFADEKYNAEISGKEIRDANTVLDLYELIKSKK